MYRDTPITESSAKSIGCVLCMVPIVGTLFFDHARSRYMCGWAWSIVFTSFIVGGVFNTYSSKIVSLLLRFDKRKVPVPAGRPISCYTSHLFIVHKVGGLVLHTVH